MGKFMQLLLRRFKRMTSLLVVKDRRNLTILNSSLLLELHLLNHWTVKMKMAFLYLNQRVQRVVLRKTQRVMRKGKGKVATLVSHQGTC
jgi:hypothetical protein